MEPPVLEHTKERNREEGIRDLLCTGPERGSTALNNVGGQHRSPVVELPGRPWLDNVSDHPSELLPTTHGHPLSPEFPVDETTTAAN
jgi:hypothetical protein